MTSPDRSSADHAQALLQEGVVASQQRQSEQALQLFEQAGRLAPTWGLPQFLLGSEYAARGEYEKAEASLANAVLLAPALHIARYQLGLLQFSSGRASVAMITWERLLDGPAPTCLAHFVRGYGALAADAYADARSHFQLGLDDPAVDPAVASDVRTVLASLPDRPNGPPDTGASHVLVSNYGKFQVH